MSAADEIQTAINKLSLYRERANVGPWFHDGSDKVTHPPSGFVGWDLWPDDAALIAVLYATIDAQLKLLTNTLALRERYAESWSEDAWLSAIERAGDLDLARAINGTAPKKGAE